MLVSLWSAPISHAPRIATRLARWHVEHAMYIQHTFHVRWGKT